MTDRRNLLSVLPAVLGALILTGTLAACQNSGHAPLKAGDDTANLRPLSASERASDFDQLLSLFKTYYGPYEYKESRLGIDIEQTVAGLKAKALAAKTDEEFAGYAMQVGALLQDGHVDINVENSSSGISRYRVPIVLTPVEHRALIAVIDEGLSNSTGLSIGDEVLEIDGKSPFAYLPVILKYRSLAQPISNEHFILYALSRPSFMTDLIPSKGTVRLKVKTARGPTVIQDIPWEATKYNANLGKLVPNKARFDLRVGFAQDFNAVVDNHIAQFGNVSPFFLTEATQQEFAFEQVYPSDETRAAFGLKSEEKPPIYAALYKYQGKTLLLVRQATYAPADFPSSTYMRAYAALISEFQDKADAMVLDQTHNPGGRYCASFYDLFAREGDIQAVQLLRADRKWINELSVTFAQDLSPEEADSWDARIVASWGLLVESAYDLGRLLSDPVPLFTGSFFAMSRDTKWEKPMLVLIDELAGSCGDLFPMLVKANGRAKLFGQTTMGLGGNVEEVGTLNNSRMHVSLTRGLFYPYNPDRGPRPEEFVENNGVSPDYFYNHTVSDFRTGFVDYVKAFSAQAVAEIPAKAP